MVENIIMNLGLEQMKFRILNYQNKINDQDSMDVIDQNQQKLYSKATQKVTIY